MNPILDEREYIPDAEARTFADGYTYIYGSKDIPGNDRYCGKSYDVFRSKDLLHWERFPNVFSNSQAHTNREGYLYAPDCEYIDGKYCLFYCMDDGSEGVAFSENPYGPFGDARPICGADGDGIDPAVFVDDDGKVYYFWGQQEARGAELDTATWSLKENSINRCLINEKEHGFHEGSSIRKRNGIYYFVYADISRGRPTCLGYCTSAHPLGPYKKRGIIIDNTGCDPVTWNNHGCIAPIKEQWYVFYHRSTNKSFYSRRACMEKIFFDDNGSIPEVEMTSQGVEDTISCTRYLGAGQVCFLKGQGYLKEYNDGQTQFIYLENLHSGDVLQYRYLSGLAEASKIKLWASVIDDPYEVVIQIDGEFVCTLRVDGERGNYCFRQYEKALENPGAAGRSVLTLEIHGPADVLGCIKGLRFE